MCSRMEATLRAFKEGHLQVLFMLHVIPRKIVEVPQCFPATRWSPLTNAPHPRVSTWSVYEEVTLQAELYVYNCKQT